VDVRLSVAFHFSPEATWEIEQARQHHGIIELAQAAFILVSESRHRHWNLAGEPHQFGQQVGINPHPPAGDLDESSGEVVVEYVFPATNHFVAPPQDAPEVFGRDKIGERRNRGRLDPALHERGDGGVNLVPAQLDGLRRQRTRTGVSGEHVGSAAPGQVIR
jgi:hypothetical protein